jgi:hypothetical protein
MATAAAATPHEPSRPATSALQDASSLHQELDPWHGEITRAEVPRISPYLCAREQGANGTEPSPEPVPRSTAQQLPFQGAPFARVLLRYPGERHPLLVREGVAPGAGIEVCSRVAWSTSGAPDSTPPSRGGDRPQPRRRISGTRLVETRPLGGDHRCITLNVAPSWHCESDIASVSLGPSTLPVATATLCITGASPPQHLAVFRGIALRSAAA